MLDRLKQKGFPGRQIDTVMQFLQNAGFIDDDALASALFIHASERKSLGKKGIRMFLAKRGIDKELIESTLSSHTVESEEKAAREFMEDKLKTLKKYPENVIKRRLWGMLLRRGFSGDVIRKVLDR